MNQGYIAGIGASAGGLDALQDFFSSLKQSQISLSFVVITHLPRDSNTKLDYLLSKVSKLKVVLLDKNTLARPDHIYILPGYLKASIKQGMIMVRKRGEDEIINRSIDEFLVSLAHDQNQNAIAVILAGMGRDGAIGAKTIHEQGGLVFVQEPGSTEFRSMPIATIDTDHPNVILSPAELGKIFDETISMREVNAMKEDRK